ncbi:MAG TPA: PEP-CTERM sorting domain-containing protein, partial [Phycisphaerae bacterium]|nr:PEP-CTERM sorting domain-containing protein [Phycisphaerae bacterium]
PNGPDYDYTITLHNTGTTNIGTFWFAWTPPGAPIEYDFLPSNPSATSQPGGWYGPASLGFPGYSIEYYALPGNEIAPGGTGTFGFTSHDSPAQLQGTSFFNFPILTSFIYEGQPEVGSFAQVTPVFVAAPAPEPASITLLALGTFALALRRRRPL